VGSCLSSKSARKARPDHLQQPLLGVRHLACASQPARRDTAPAIGPSPSPPPPPVHGRRRRRMRLLGCPTNCSIVQQFPADYPQDTGGSCVGCAVHTTGFPCLTSVCKCRAASCHSITSPGYAVRQLLRPSCRLDRPVSANLQCASRR
jgi:hypothetical protein